MVVRSSVLPAGSIDVRESFFDQGGHSLLATRLLAAVRSKFNVEVPLRRLFESPTLQEIAGAIDELGGTGAAGVRDVIQKVARKPRASSTPC